MRKSVLYMIIGVSFLVGFVLAFFTFEDVESMRRPFIGAFLASIIYTVFLRRPSIKQSYWATHLSLGSGAAFGALVSTSAFITLLTFPVYMLGSLLGLFISPYIYRLISLYPRN